MDGADSRFLREVFPPGVKSAMPGSSIHDVRWPTAQDRSIETMKNMLKSSFLWRTVAVAAIFLGPIGLLTFANPGGPLPGFTNAPGEGNCTFCHATFPINSGPAGFAITAPIAPTPGVAQALGVGFTNSSTFRHGFQITARDGADAYLGTWQATTALTKNATGNLHHEQNLAGSLVSSWTFNWTPPATITNGPIIFYAAGVEGINDDSPLNDHVYTTVAKMYQATLSTATTAWPIGTSQLITLAAPTHAGQIYLIVPSNSATPVSLGGPLLLEVDPNTGFLDLALQLPTIFQNILGILDGTGQATATIAIPFFPPLIGLPLHFAAATADGTLSPTEVSNRVSITFQ
jgi:hypothetical protein